MSIMRLLLLDFKALEFTYTGLVKLSLKISISTYNSSGIKNIT